VVRTNPLPHVRHSHLFREAQARAGFQSSIPGSRTEEGARGLASSVLPFLSTCPSWTPSVVRQVGVGGPASPDVGHLVWEMLQGRRNDREMELTGAHPLPNLVSALAVQIQTFLVTKREIAIVTSSAIYDRGA